MTEKLTRTLTGQPAFKDVPAPVVERITSQAKVGIGLLVLAVLLVAGVLVLAGYVKGIEWKLVGMLLVIPFFLAVVGANMVSQKVTAAAIQSIAAFVRALRGKNGEAK